MSSKPRRKLRICDLPLDIIVLISKILLPYDLLSLSSTCSPFRQVFFDRSVWLHISDLVSRSKPFPFSIGRAENIPIIELQKACLRSQRIAQNCALDEIPTRSARKLQVSKKAFIEYFTFLPGSKHILVYDANATLSCWTCGGRKLTEFAMEKGSMLTRWKPKDEGEVPDMPDDARAIDIMLDEPKLGRSGRRYCQVLTLTYTDTTANFATANKFSVPPVYDLYSALAHGDLNGMLVHINKAVIGIYLVDANSDKAICFQTGIAITNSPQALLSAHHMVLYWESHARGAYVRSYSMSTLRRLLHERGVPQDDINLRNPVHLEPDYSRVIPFSTVTSDTFKRLRSPNQNGDTGFPAFPEGMNGNVVDVAELEAGFADMHLNDEADFFQIDDVGVENLGGGLVFDEDGVSWDLSPIIIPKWTTLREDLTRHRTRSIMSFSVQLNGALNMGPQDFQDEFDDWGQPQGNVNGDVVINGHDHPEDQVAHAENHVHDDIPPNHMYEQEPGHLHLAQPPLPPHAEPALVPPHLNHPDVDVVHLNGINLNGAPIVVPVDGDHQLEVNDFEFFGGRATISHHYFDFEAHPLELKRTIIAEVILREPPRMGIEGRRERTFSASPIMGVGGRGAVWVQQNAPIPKAGAQSTAESDEASHRRPSAYVRLATFPSFEGERDDGAFYHEELDVRAGQVSTVLLPPEIDLDKVIMFDLDDVRGFIGVVTMEEGNTCIWLVDYS